MPSRSQPQNGSPAALGSGHGCAAAHHLAPPVAELGERRRIVVARHNGAQDVHPRDARDVGHHVMQLHVHLNQRPETPGMRPPVVAVGDGALGFWAAVRDVWPKTREQRDWFHKLGNILDKLRSGCSRA
jgi:hypothetical protein